MATNTQTLFVETSDTSQTKTSGFATKYQLIRLDPEEESGSCLLVNQSLLAERKGTAPNHLGAPVVSFLGSQSGAGKSRIASLLLSDTIPSVGRPIIADERQLEPETDGIWLYPGIQLTQDPKSSPSIVIDTEAMGGQVPRGVARRLRDDVMSPQWLHDVMTQHGAKRKRVTTDVVPALLHIISDVLVFVHQNPTHDSSMVDTLVHIGDRALDEAVDTAGPKPALMIIQNKFRVSSESTSAEEDMDVTEQFLRDFDPDERLSKYYTDVRVFRMPRRDDTEATDALFHQSVTSLKRHLSDLCGKVPGRLTLQATQTIGLPPIRSDKLFWTLMERLLHKVNEYLHNQEYTAKTASFQLHDIWPDVTNGLFRSLEPRTTGFEAVLAKLVQRMAPGVRPDSADDVRKVRGQYPELARGALDFLASALALDLLGDAEMVSLQDLEVGHFVERSFESAAKLVNEWAPCTAELSRDDGTTYPCTLLFRDHGNCHGNPVELKTGQIFSCSSSSSSLTWPGRFQGGDLKLMSLAEFVTKVKEAIAADKHVLPRVRAQGEQLKKMFVGDVPPLGRVCVTCLSERVHVMMSCGHAMCARDAAEYMEDRETAASCPLHDSSTTRVVEVRPGGLRLPTPQNVGVRVLSLDGGGIRGVVILEVLKKIEEMAAPYSTNLRLYELFDVIVGTSVGSIIGCGIGLGGLNAEEAREALLDVFPKLVNRSTKRSVLPYSISKYFGPRYGEKARRPFETVYGDLPLSSVVRNENAQRVHVSRHVANGTNQTPSRSDDVKLTGIRPDGPLMTGLSLPVMGVCAYDVTNERVTTFSSHDSHELTIADAVAASSAAPMFFSSVVLQHKGRRSRYTDGEILAKCPAAEGRRLAEEVWPDRPVDLLLSVGCGVRPEEKRREPDDFSDNLRGWHNICYDLPQRFRRGNQDR